MFSNFCNVFSSCYIYSSTILRQWALKLSCSDIIRYLTAENAWSSLKASSDSYCRLSFEFTTLSTCCIHSLWSLSFGCFAVNSISYRIASNEGSGFFCIVDCLRQYMCSSRTWSISPKALFLVFLFSKSMSSSIWASSSIACYKLISVVTSAST